MGGIKPKARIFGVGCFYGACVMLNHMGLQLRSCAYAAPFFLHKHTPCQFQAYIKEDPLKGLLCHAAAGLGFFPYRNSIPFGYNFLKINCRLKSFSNPSRSAPSTSSPANYAALHLLASSESDNSPSSPTRLF